MIIIEDITVAYGSVVPLRRVSLEIDKSPTVIMGPSGSGKSTLLRVLSGLQRPDSGRVLLNGTPLTNPTWQSAGDQRVALIHQDYRLVPFLSVRDNIALAAELRGAGPVPPVTVADWLSRVGLAEDFLERQAGTLSGGEQQRVAIARALVSGAELLVADEPTGALDSGNTRRVTEVLIDVQRAAGIDVVIATHDHQVADMIANRLTLAEGSLCIAA